MGNLNETISNCEKSIQNWSGQVEKCQTEIANVGLNHAKRNEELSHLDSDSDEFARVKSIVEQLESAYAFAKNRQLPLMQKNLAGRKEELQFWLHEKKKFLERLGKAP